MPTTRKCNSAIVLLIAGLALVLPATAQVFKWTDENGKIHYGDKPPDHVKKQDVKINVMSFGGPPEIDEWTAILKRPPAVRGYATTGETGALTMYSATWCGPCRRAKAHLAEKGIAYRDVDIDDSESNKAEFKSYGGGGVPLFIAGKKRMRGFNPEGLDKLLASAR
jgi:glutaredoxin